MTDAAPTPRPPTMRQNERSQTPNARPQPSALTTNRIAAMSMTRMRPYRSAMRPANHAPIAQPMQRRCDREAEQERAGVELLADRAHRAVDDGGVEAEEEPAEGRGRGDQDDAGDRDGDVWRSDGWCRTHGRSSSFEPSTSSVARLRLTLSCAARPCQGRRAWRGRCRGYSEHMPVTLLGAAEIRALAAELDVTPTKKLGQNFVVDANSVRRIVQVARRAARRARRRGRARVSDR